MGQHSLNNMIENAAEHHSRAVQRRNAGIPTGKPALGWVRKPAAIDPDDRESYEMHCKRQLQKALWNALNEYQAAILTGPGYEAELEAFGAAFAAMGDDNACPF